VTCRRFVCGSLLSSATSFLAGSPRHSLCENYFQTSQVLRFAKLFPKLCLSDEGLTTVCLQLRKVRRKTFSLFVFFMLTVFPLLCLQLVTAHFKHGERTWSAENIEGEYHFGSI
jgi:hypothetical protein